MHMSTLRGRNLGLIAFVIILLAGLIAAPLLTSASTFTAGFQVERSGDRIENDLYIAAFRATIDADVDGDVSLAAVTTEINGDVGGSVHALAGTSTINGEVGGTLYVAGGITRLNGTIDGNVIVTGGRLELGNEARVGGDLITFSAQSRIGGDVDGKIYGSVLLYSQSGSVSGNLDIQADRITLADTATVGDDLNYQSQTDADIHASASIGGETNRTNATPWNGIGDGALAPFGQMLRLVWSMIAGAILIACAPRLFYKAAANAAQVLPAGIAGILGLILVPLIAIVMFLSVLMLPVGVLLMVLMTLAMYLTQIVVGITIGRSILPRRWRDGSRGFLLFAMVVGSIIIGALRMAPVPYLNAIVLVLVSIWGFGALLMLLNDLTSSRTRAEMNRA